MKTNEAGNDIPHFVNKQGPIMIERLKSQLSPPYVVNYAALNLQFISIQKMDTVLHSVQRRLYKQKEQQAFSQFLKNCCNSKDTGLKVAEMSTEQATYREKRPKSSSKSNSNNGRVNNRLACNPQNRPSRSEGHIEAQAADLDMCIAMLKSILIQGKMGKFGADNKIDIYPGTQKSVTIPERKRLVHQSQSRKQKLISTKQWPIAALNDLQDVSHPDPSFKPLQQLTAYQSRDRSRTMPEKYFKYQTHFSNRRKTTNTKKRTSGMHIKNITQHQQTMPLRASISERDTRETFDVPTMWQRLVQIGKIEDMVHKNLQIMNMENNCEVIETKSTEYPASRIFKPILPETDHSLETPKSTVKPSYQFSQPVGELQYPSYTSMLLSPNSDIVALIKELSNSLVDDLLNEVSNEFADLPDTFLTELVEIEFASNQLLR